MIKIPSEEGRFSQPNNGDRFGNIWLTKNINFDEEGYIKMSSGQYLLSSTDANFAEIEAMFASQGSDVYFLSGDVFSNSVGLLSVESNLTNLTTSESAPTPGVEDDGIYFNGTEVISDSTSVYWNNSGTWTLIASTSLPASGAVAMEVFDEQNSLLIGKGNKVAIVNTSWVVGTSLTLPADYEVTSIVCIGATAYIATKHVGNGDAKLFLWNGSGAANDGAYSVGAAELSVIKNYQSSIVGLDCLGRLLRFNGGGFDMITAFPVYYSKYIWGSSGSNNSILSNRGMVVEGDLIYFSIAPDIERGEFVYLDYLPGGLWCYDPKVGLYHRNGKTISKLLIDNDVDTSEINTTTDVITVSGITVPATGTPVFYADGGTPIGGLTDNTWYFTIKVTDTTFKVARTLEDAISETAIDLTSTSDNNDFYFVPRIDYSQTFFTNRHSVLALTSDALGNSGEENIIHTNGRLLRDKTDTEIYGINFMQSSLENRSYVVTPKIFSQNIEDVINQITLRFKELKYGDKILIKYRNSHRENMPSLPRLTTDRATWTSTTTFTTTRDLAQVIIGDEVEIIGGQGAGHIAHISAISESSGTYTITIDDPCVMASNGDYMRYIITDFKYVDSIDHTWTNNWKSIPIDQNSSWVQFKIEMRGREVALSDIIIDNKSYHPVQK